ncbi:DUF1156 domain-containing protein [Rhizohabitans arisaemae]|uniref:DUF1156 domain-containing protein n=1 Tax=Rhizohabitans arisaemae TaxID=2720610 RepID=UPI0024B1CA8D|nr:DUF1156 domain-containing protein [Rhizohabitans arisaemae]
MSSTLKRKLIEVSLPLEIINKESAREKSIRHGHPSTLHLWWARRPLAACRAVLFAQLVDDPSAHPDRFPTEEDREKERKRLFRLIERLVVWENTTDPVLLKEAHEEILKSTGGKPPTILDPFAGGGSIPLEAQRLGLEAYASDLNPVPVLINKALIEIPPKWVGRPPVFPGAADEVGVDAWPNATGLGEDVRRYGQWMREEAEKLIGKHYPKAILADGTEGNVIAWIWARTVTCPNPACGIQIPLTKTWWLSKKKGREVFAIPVIEGRVVSFKLSQEIKRGPSKAQDGTVGRTGVTCIACGNNSALAHVRAAGKAGLIGHQLMAIVAENRRGRAYLSPTEEQELAAQIDRPEDIPETELPEAALGFRVQGYGMTHHSDLFTNRQLILLATYSKLVGEVASRIVADAIAAGYGDFDAEERARAVGLYLALAVSRTADLNNSLVTWSNSRDQARNLFSRQAIPMAWDFVEVHPFAKAAGDVGISVETAAKVLAQLPSRSVGKAERADASTRSYDGCLVATDPPYYDNIGYADLADFFYVWLRQSVISIYPEETSTMLTPKADELVADAMRFGGDKLKAEQHFEEGFVKVFSQIRESAPFDIPITVFYAFKQAEGDADGVASTGWETMLAGLARAGFSVTGTWPIRTERSGRSRDNESNALASSIVLACRPRPEDAGTISAKVFLDFLRDELPDALNKLQQGAIAPVDLAQAAIGPGMAVFSRYAAVIEADGKHMLVRTALKLINQILDEVLSEQEGDFDAETRFCVKWFTQYGWNDADSGTADTLSRAMNTTVEAVERGSVFRAKAGRARLLAFEELSANWNPLTDDRISLWEVVLRLAKALAEVGGQEAARLMALARQRVDLDAAQELAYLLFSLCEKRNLTQDAILFNGLGQSWFDLTSSSLKLAATLPKPVQGQLDLMELGD